MAVDQAERQNLSSLFLPGGMVESVNPCLILMVRRENVVEDTMEVLRKSKNVDYKKPLKVIIASPLKSHLVVYLVVVYYSKPHNAIFEQNTHFQLLFLKSFN